MNIGIDARLYGQGFGLGRYVSKLLEHLEKNDCGHTYIIFLRKNNFALYTPRNAHFRKVCADVPWYSLAEQIMMPFYFLKERCDLVHIPHFNIPLFYPKKVIVTIHDLILLKHPQSATVAASTRSPLYHWIKYCGYRLIIRECFRRACIVITVSSAVAEDIANFFPIAKNRIRVIHEAADPLPTPTLPSGIDALAVKRFFFYAGNAYPHKNLSTLIEAMARLHRIDSSAILFLCGQDDFFQRRVSAEIDRAGYGPFILHLGCVSDAELRWLYEHAAAIVLPSQEEGFGLQLVEAFHHSCPVIASDIAAYREVSGGAALLVETRTADSLTRAMISLLRDNTLRSGMIERGSARAKLFSWKRCARETAQQYIRCLTML